MSWEQLLSIYVEADQYARDERVQPPVACPFDGEPLSTTPDGFPQKRLTAGETQAEVHRQQRLS